MGLPDKSQLFGKGLSAAEISKEWDGFTDAVNKSISAGDARQFEPAADLAGVAPGLMSSMAPQGGVAMLEKAMASPDLEKSIGADAFAALRKSLDAQKDITISSPVSTGLVPFDLQAPAKFLVPTETPLRNRIPRTKGQGLAARYKVITGITGSGTGGVGVFHPGITEATQNNFAPPGGASVQPFNRGAKISYAGGDKIVPYEQFGVSDSVTWAAGFAGQGFQDPRALSAAALLYSSMLLEERLMLMGRGTDSNFLGALAAPSAPTLASAAAASGESNISGATTNIYVKVTADAGDFGQSSIGAVASIAAPTGVVVVTVPAVTGALGYRVYVGTGGSQPADSAMWYAGRTGSRTFRITGALPTSGTAATVAAADTSAYAAGYDGILPIVMGANSGYRATLNANWNASIPGVEFQTAFEAMWAANQANPKEILMAGHDRRTLSDLLQSSSVNAYRFTITQDEITGATMGGVVTAIQNEITGQVVDLTVHPFMPQGNAALMTWQLPIPDSNVGSVWESRNVQDYMGVNWPVVDFQYAQSSYWFGTFICYAPAWCGGINGIAY